MKYKIYKAVPKESVDALIELSKIVKFSKSGGSNTRIGANKEKNLSVYEYSKWLRWDRHKRRIFESNIIQEQAQVSIQNWFMKVPPEVGHLDVMDTWVGNPNPASIVSMSLYDGQVITIGDEDVKVNAGESIGFQIDILHSIKKSPEGQLWACTMSRHPFYDLEY